VKERKLEKGEKRPTRPANTEGESKGPLMEKKDKGRPEGMVSKREIQSQERKIGRSKGGIFRILEERGGNEL